MATIITPFILAQLSELDPADAVVFLDSVQQARQITEATTPKTVDLRRQLLEAIHRELGTDPNARFDEEDLDDINDLDESLSACAADDASRHRRASLTPSVGSSISVYSEADNDTNNNNVWFVQNTSDDEDRASKASSLSRYSCNSTIEGAGVLAVAFAPDQLPFNFKHEDATYLYVGRCRAPSPFPADPIKKGGFGILGFFRRLTRSWCRSSGRDG